MQYIYLEEFEIDKDIAEDLFKLAHEYMLEKLKNDCEKVFIKDIKLENVIKSAQLAEKYEAENLRKACLGFICENFEEIFRTQNFKELDVEIFIDLYKRNY